MWAANSPCPPVVVLPKKSGPHPSWETVAVLGGWVTVRGIGGHIFTAPRGTLVETDGGGGAAAHGGAPDHTCGCHHLVGGRKASTLARPDTRVIWRDPPILRATIWSGGAGRHLAGALPWLRDCGDASPPPAKMRTAL